MVPFKSLGTVSYSHSIVTIIIIIIIRQRIRRHNMSIKSLQGRRLWSYLVSFPRYWLKSQFFSYPVGGFVLSYHAMHSITYYHTIWHGKTRMVWLVWLLNGEKVWGCVQPLWHNTSIWWTDKHHVTAQSELCIASHSKNKPKIWQMFQVYRYYI